MSSWSVSLDPMELREPLDDPVPSKAKVCSESKGGAHGSVFASSSFSKMNCRNTALSGPTCRDCLYRLLISMLLLLRGFLSLMTMLLLNSTTSKASESSSPPPSSSKQNIFSPNSSLFSGISVCFLRCFIASIKMINPGEKRTDEYKLTNGAWCQFCSLCLWHKFKKSP